MQFFVLLRRRTEAFTDDAFAALLDDEAARVRELYGDGVIRAAYSRQDVPGAMLLVEAAHLDEVDEIVATLPLAERNMLDVQVIHVRGYRGFAR